MGAFIAMPLAAMNADGIQMQRLITPDTTDMKTLALDHLQRIDTTTGSP